MRISVVTAVVLFWVANSVAHAASPAASNSSTANTNIPATSSDELNEIVVTGSRLETSLLNSTSVVTTYTAQDLAISSALSVADALNKLPQFSDGTNRLQSAICCTVGAGYGDILNLRGLGTNRTLIMLDGVRMPPTQPDGSVDVGILPTALLQRIDIVTGGASANYGSDAVVGVVNYILDSNFTGVKGQFAGGVSRYGDAGSYNASLAAGMPFADNNGHVLVSVQQWANRGIASVDDRPGSFVSQGGNGTLANPYHNVTDAKYGIMTDGGSPFGPIGFLTQTFLPNGTLGPYDHGPVNTGNTVVDQGGNGGRFVNNTYVPNELKDNLFLRLSYDLNPHLHAFVQTTYQDRHTDGAQETNASFIVSKFVATILPGNAYLNPAVAPLVTQPFELGEVYAEMPADVNSTVNTSTITQAGLAGDIVGSWTWDATAVYGYNHLRINDLETYIPYQTAALDAVVGPNGNIVCNVSLTNPGLYPGCTPLNLMGYGNASLAAINYITGNSIGVINNTMKVVNANAKGELFDIWDGPVKGAFGGEVRWQSLQQLSNIDSNVPVDTTGLRGSPPNSLYFQTANFGTTYGTVEVKEIYSEIFAPMLRDLAFAKSMDLDLAYRVTDYSTSGRVETWKVGLLYQPFQDLRLRGSVSRDIRAPSLNELYQGAQITGGINYDPVTGLTNADSLITKGNPNLQPERATTYTAGLTYTPSQLFGFVGTVDYYNIKVKDAIQALTAQQILNDCSATAPAYSSPECALINRPFPPSNTSPGNFPISIDTIPLNIGELDQSGIDAQVNYTGDMSTLVSSWRGSFQLGGIFQYLIDYKSQEEPGAPFIRLAGFGTNERKKGSIYEGYSIGPLSIRVTERFTGRSNRSLPGPTQYYSDYQFWPDLMYTDLSLIYRLKEGIEAFINVDNVFNVENPPYGSDSGLAGFVGSGNRQIYDIVGTYYTAGVRFKLGGDGGARSDVQFFGGAGGAPIIPTSGVYGSMASGLVFTQSDTVNLKQPVLAGGFATAPVVPADISFKTGWALLTTAGYKWDFGLRSELELSTRQSDVNRFNGTGGSGVQENWAAMANVLYDFRFSKRFTPYVGAGLGIDQVHWRYVTQDVDPTFLSQKSVLEWQAIAGVSVPILNNTEVYAEDHYIHVGTTSFVTQPWDPGNGVGSQVTNHNDRSNNLVVGFRYTF
jgi:iron complex outermembrane receptor protein